MPYYVELGAPMQLIPNNETTAPLPGNTACTILGLGGRAHNHTEQRTLRAEVDAYLSDSQEGTGTVSYWQVGHHYLYHQHLFTYAIIQENQVQYPTIYKLALDILPIQGSVVPCEQVFSSSKETMTARRGQISPELMEALHILKFLVRQGRGLNFTEGWGWDDELQELEELMDEWQQIPEDISSFIATLMALGEQPLP
jgi:hypothetical protein